MIRKKGRCAWAPGSGGRQGRNEGSHVQGLGGEGRADTGGGEPLKVCKQGD